MTRQQLIRAYAYVGITIVALVIAAAYIVREVQVRELRAELAQTRSKTRALDDFCRATRISHDTALRAFEDSSSTWRNATAHMLTEDAVYFGYTSVRTCLRDRMPPLEDDCTLDGYACVAKQTRLYRDALVRAGW